MRQSVPSGSASASPPGLLGGPCCGLARAIALSAAVLMAISCQACAPRVQTSLEKGKAQSVSEQDTSAVFQMPTQEELVSAKKESSFARRYEVAKHLVSIGELKQAVSHLRKLRRTARNGLEKAMVNEARASLYLARGELRRAENLASEAVKASSSFAPAYRTRALIRKEGGDLVGAVDDFTSALALLPEDLESLRGLTEAHLAQASFHAALEVLDRLLEVDPLDAWAQDKWCTSMASVLGYSEFPLDYLRMLRRDRITRGELAALLVVEREMILFQTEGNRHRQYEGDLPDVPDCDGSWFEPFARKAVSWKLLRLYPDGTFRPSDTVRKGTLAVELYYFLRKHCAVAPTELLRTGPLSSPAIEDPDGLKQWNTSGYLDVRGSTYLRIPVRIMVDLGILEPDSDIVFGTESTLEGAQARKMARNMARMMASLGCEKAD
ncbi:MAG: hypothetical protein AMJ46_11200 [Latescibacteria bacterium DG_63]|nr:MAG: hypothetical protein AMJ46_11200 [Latescibacteria bacterium DG_63]